LSHFKSFEDIQSNVMKPLKGPPKNYFQQCFQALQWRNMCIKSESKYFESDHTHRRLERERERESVCVCVCVCVKQYYQVIYLSDHVFYAVCNASAILIVSVTFHVYFYFNWLLFLLLFWVLKEEGTNSFLLHPSLLVCGKLWLL